MDKNKKNAFRRFTLFEYDKEQKYLEDMHKKGWKLKGITPIVFQIFEIYHFVKCESEEMVYQLDYNQDGIDNKEYIKLFEDCGWEYVYDYEGFTYFCKPETKMQGREEIFCDDESRLDMMKRILQRRILPMIAIFFLSLVPSFINFYLYLNMGSIKILSVISVSIFMIFLIYVWTFVSSAINYRRLRKNIVK